jgi:predicted ester cyclase
MRKLALAGWIGCVIVACAPAAAGASDADANKELYRHFMDEIWNKRDLSAIDRYVAPGLIEHNPNIPQGLEGRKQFAAAVQAAFPDYHAEVQDIVAVGDRLVARVVWTGTQDGPYQGRPPTHNKLRFSTADFFRIENGKFVEHWDVVDSFPRAIALGLVQPPAAAKP